MNRAEKSFQKDLIKVLGEQIPEIDIFESEALRPGFPDLLLFSCFTWVALELKVMYVGSKTEMGTNNFKRLFEKTQLNFYRQSKKKNIRHWALVKILDTEDQKRYFLLDTFNMQFIVNKCDDALNISLNELVSFLKDTLLRPHMERV